MKFSTVVRSLEVQEREEVTLSSNPVLVFAKEALVIRRGFYVCNNHLCQKTFTDVASKRRHMARCIGGK